VRPGRRPRPLRTQRRRRAHDAHPLRDSVRYARLFEAGRHADAAAVVAVRNRAQGREAERVRVASAAAVRVAVAHGYVGAEPVVLNATNNLVVWLRPHDIVAKVGRPQNDEALRREHVVAAALAAEGAPIARPLVDPGPTRDPESNLIVTVWERLDHDSGRKAAPAAIATSLRRLHDGLARYDGELPSFRESLDRARAALVDDRLTEAVAGEDRSLLFDAFDRLGDELEAFSFDDRPLHGEPHEGNLLVTASGLRWIDLEAACRGPLEWDLAFLPEPAAGLFPEIRPELLSLLRTLNSACVATWCSLRAEFEELRWHRDHHLEQVRRAHRDRISRA
jgi:hypothetical protein